MTSRLRGAVNSRVRNLRIALFLAILTFSAAMPLWAGQVTFGVPSLPADWFTVPWSAGGAANVSGGNLVVDGARAGTNSLYGPGEVLEFTANFSGDPWQHIGFGTDYNAGPWIIFSTFQGGQLYARTNSESGQLIDTPLSASWLGVPHRYRIEWRPDSIVFSIDGSVVANHPLTVSSNLRPLISDLNVGGGNLELSSITMSTPVLNADLSGPGLPAGWSSNAWAGGGSATVANGILTVDGARVGTDALYSPGESLEFAATFSGDPWQHIGFGTDYSAAPWFIFSTYGGGQLYARSSTSAGQAIDSLLPGDWLGSPHRFRIDWSATNATFMIDGTIVASHAATAGASLRPLISDFNVGGGNLAVSSIGLNNSIFRIDFASSSLPAGWFSGAYSPSGAATINGNGLSVDGAQVGTYTLYNPGQSAEFVATLTGDPMQHLGFGVDYNSGPWIIFSTYQGGQLYARTKDDSGEMVDTPIPGDWFGAPHHYRIDWNNSGAVFSIDSVAVASQPVTISAGLRLLISDLNSGSGVVNVQSVNLSP
ncbi:MAG: hypothetical protein JOZ29_11950 [Deltaproteobacteria bacterium]|nr:hypothetical protein [Deltaproteobacteria bacterium]